MMGVLLGPQKREYLANLKTHGEGWREVDMIMIPNVTGIPSKERRRGEESKASPLSQSKSDTIIFKSQPLGA
jgi:hypothetical protein